MPRRSCSLHTPPSADSEESYAYGWSISDSNHGQIAWHDGGNSWSLAVYARSLQDSTHDTVMAFWVSSHAYQQAGWNLEDLASELTHGILDRARSQTS
jgi:hypothetical protein